MGHCYPWPIFSQKIVRVRGLWCIFCRIERTKGVLNYFQRTLFNEILAAAKTGHSPCALIFLPKKLPLGGLATLNCHHTYQAHWMDSLLQVCLWNYFWKISGHTTSNTSSTPPAQYPASPASGANPRRAALSWRPLINQLSDFGTLPPPPPAPR